MAFGAEGLPKSVMERREPVFLRAEALGEPLPALDLGVGTAPLRWVLAYPVALGSRGRGRDRARRHPHAGRRRRRSRCATPRGSSRWRCTTRGRTTGCARRASRSPSRASDSTRANKVKTAFLASMSHELRTPLSAILGFADLLLTSSKEQLSPRARESLERIKRNGEHLLEPHQRRARPGEGRGGARRGAPRAGQRRAARARLRRGGREPALGQEPAARRRRGRGADRDGDRRAARAADPHQPPGERAQVHRRGRGRAHRARHGERGPGRRARHGHRHPGARA